MLTDRCTEKTLNITFLAAKMIIALSVVSHWIGYGNAFEVLIWTVIL